MQPDSLQYREWKPTKYCDIKVVDLEYAAELNQKFEYDVMLEIGRLQEQLTKKGVNGLDEMFDGLKSKIHELALVMDGKLSVTKETKRIYKD